MQHDVVDALLLGSVDGFLAAASWVVVVVLEDFLLLLLEGCFLESSLLSLLLL